MTKIEVFQEPFYLSPPNTDPLLPSVKPGFQFIFYSACRGDTRSMKTFSRGAYGGLSTSRTSPNFPLKPLPRLHWSRRKGVLCSDGRENANCQRERARRRVRESSSPRGKTYRWTPELDEVPKSAWALGGLRVARSATCQHQSTWSIYSIKKRAAALAGCHTRPRAWTQGDTDHMLWSIDSNASLTSIAERLGQTVGRFATSYRSSQTPSIVWLGTPGCNNDDASGRTQHRDKPPR